VVRLRFDLVGRWSGQSAISTAAAMRCRSVSENSRAARPWSSAARANAESGSARSRAPAPSVRFIGIFLLDFTGVSERSSVDPAVVLIASASVSCVATSRSEMPSIWIVFATCLVACAAAYAFYAQGRGGDGLRAFGTGLWLGPYRLARLLWGKPRIPEVEVKCQHCARLQVIEGDVDSFQCRQCFKRSTVPNQA
jgi:hypothetical protein